MTSLRWAKERDEIIELLYRIRVDHDGIARNSTVRKFGPWAEEAMKRAIKIRWLKRTGRPERIELTPKGEKALTQALIGWQQIFYGGALISDPRSPYPVEPLGSPDYFGALQEDLTREDFAPVLEARDVVLRDKPLRLGFPGLMAFAHVLEYPKDHPLGGKELDTGGYPGKYVVTLVLRRRGAPDIPNIVHTDHRALEGDSHLLLPEGFRGETVAEGKVQQLMNSHALEDGEVINFLMLPNRWGRLGKIQVEVRAQRAEDASTIAYKKVVPVLCDFSFRRDVPMEVLQTNIVERTTLTHIAKKEIDSPTQEMPIDFFGPDGLNY
jgi:hypothetical protein